MTHHATHHTFASRSTHVTGTLFKTKQDVASVNDNSDKENSDKENSDKEKPLDLLTDDAQLTAPVSGDLQPGNSARPIHRRNSSISDIVSRYESLSVAPPKPKPTKVAPQPKPKPAQLKPKPAQLTPSAKSEPEPEQETKSPSVNSLIARWNNM